MPSTDVLVVLFITPGVHNAAVGPLKNIAGYPEKAAPRLAMIHIEDGVPTDRQTDRQTDRPTFRPTLSRIELQRCS